MNLYFSNSFLVFLQIANGIKAILVKVAAIGLDPSKHLGKDLAFMEPHLLKLKEYATVIFNAFTMSLSYLIVLLT